MNLISVTRLNGDEIRINADLIETLEATPDTLVTLTTGKRMMVSESVDEVVARAIAYRSRIDNARTEFSEGGSGV